MEGSNLELGLYDLNKQIISQLPALTDFSNAIINIRKLHEKYWNKYYMMYGKEISYFTLFQKQMLAADNFVSAVFKCLRNLGNDLRVFEVIDENTIEIWIGYEDDVTCMYLFNYDEGVVIYNG